jgi:23S rRNA-/tRNA-specific pseudouridylate synthase/2-polyprenyl-3-methyl-5-hydroxy-6-metoxy-1,4-benzoquinol methylase
VLHLDDEVIAILKPAGVLTAAQHARRATALDLTRNLLKARRQRDTRAFVVHEVDRDASGVLVFARTHEAAEALRRQFRSRKTTRIYEALVEGVFEPADAGAAATTTIRTRLVENRRGVVESVPDTDAAPTGPHKPLAAVTHARVVASGDGLTLVRLRAETDHPFQLRAHMAEQGHPVAGDAAYGSTRREFSRLALHLGEVTFEHPSTGERVRLHTPPPAFFSTAVGKAPPRDAKPDVVETPEGVKVPTQWDRVSEWYDNLLREKGHDHYDKVLIPRTLSLLDPEETERLLDIACGQGALSRAAAERGAAVLGVDLAERLIERARAIGGDRIEYRVGDAQHLEQHAEPASFDAAACLMALMNIPDLDATLAGAAAALRRGGRFVGVILHPAFRTPRQTAWGWEGMGTENPVQFRRVDAYLRPSSIEITMNPGAHSSGAAAVKTTTFHRPISAYIAAAAKAGLVIDALEEWPSERRSNPGPRADAEDRARAEIPMFLAFRALKPPIA